MDAERGGAAAVAAEMLVAVEYLLAYSFPCGGRVELAGSRVAFAGRVRGAGLRAVAPFAYRAGSFVQIAAAVTDLENVAGHFSSRFAPCQ